MIYRVDTSDPGILRLTVTYRDGSQKVASTGFCARNHADVQRMVEHLQEKVGKTVKAQAERRFPAHEPTGGV